MKLAAMIALLLLAAPATAAAEGLHHPPVDVLPAPVYDARWETLGPDVPAPLETSAPAIDWSAGPLARRAGMTIGPASVAIVMTESLYHPGDVRSRGWQRFFQDNPEAPALTVSCGRGDDVYRAMESFQLGPGPDGAMRYAHQTAWFNQMRCKGRLLRSVEARPEPLAGGLVYAYRTRCARCAEGAREVLHLVIPAVVSVSLLGDGAWVYWSRIVDHVSFSIEPGASGTLSATFDGEAIAGWNRVAPSPLPVRETRLRVEITRASGDAEATVLAEAR